MAHRDLTLQFLQIRSFPTRALTPYPSIQKPLLPSSPNPHIHIHSPSWTAHADEANAIMRMIVVQLHFLQTLHTKRLMIRFDENERHYEIQVENSTNEIMALFSRADDAMHRITEVSNDAVVDRVVRMNTQRSIAQRLQALSVDFRRSQCGYLRRLEQQKEPMIDGGVQALLEARDGEIKKIVESIAMLARIFHEVAKLVIDQGSVVDRIDYHVNQTLLYVRNGHSQMKIAEKQQRFARSEKCIALLTALNVFCFLLLVLKHSR